MEQCPDNHSDAFSIYQNRQILQKTETTAFDFRANVHGNCVSIHQNAGFFRFSTLLRAISQRSPAGVDAAGSVPFWRLAGGKSPDFLTC